MKTVAYITASVDPGIDVGRFSREVILRAASRGHTARVLTWEGDTVDEELATAQRVEVHPVLPSAKALHGLWRNVRCGKRAAAQLARCDMVHTLFDYPHTELGARIARRLDVPLVVSALGPSSIAPLYRRPHGGRLAVAMLEAHRVIAGSRLVLDEIEKLLALPNAAVVPVGTMPPDGIPETRREGSAPFGELDPFTVLGVDKLADDDTCWDTIVDEILALYPSDEPRRVPSEARLLILGRW